MTLMSLLASANHCLATVDIASTEPIHIPVDYYTPKVTSSDVAKVYPADSFKPGSDSTVIMNKFADLTVNYFVSTWTTNESSFARFAESTRNKLKADLVIPSSGRNAPAHKFVVRVEAFTAQAKMEYTGWLNAALNYDARSEGTAFTINEKLFSNTSISLRHETSKVQSASMISLAWPW